MKDVDQFYRPKDHQKVLRILNDYKATIKRVDRECDLATLFWVTV